MNVPVQTTANGVASQVISAAACVLLYSLVTNTSGGARFYLLADAASAPTLTAAAIMPPCGGILSPRIAASGTWRASPVDAVFGAGFSKGCVLLSFATNADGSPNFTALSAADANLVAWSAPLA